MRPLAESHEYAYNTPSMGRLRRVEMATGLAPHDGYAIRNAPYQQFSAIVRQWAAESVLPRRITGTRPESTEPTRTGEAPQERTEAQQPTPIATATPKARTAEARARAKRLGAATARLGRQGVRRAQHEARLRRLGRQIEGEKAARLAPGRASFRAPSVTTP